jgi:secondary thiamine-phosphate synthase enzyme
MWISRATWPRALLLSELKQAHGELNVPTRGKGLYEITREVRKWVGGQGIGNGLVTIFIQHTSASLTIQENADPDVKRDLGEFFERLVPEDTPWFRHVTEGSDDMPSHIRAALTATQLAVPLRGRDLALGMWQGIYVFEHRSEPQVRHVLLHALGE